MKRKGYSKLEQQLEADKRYRNKNRKYRNYLSKRSAARSFIRNDALINDIEELSTLLINRKKMLINNTEHMNNKNPSPND